MGRTRCASKPRATKRLIFSCWLASAVGALEAAATKPARGAGGGLDVGAGDAGVVLSGVSATSSPRSDAGISWRSSVFCEPTTPTASMRASQSYMFRQKRHLMGRRAVGESKHVLLEVDAALVSRKRRANH
jgi:hypothetical protein